MTPPTPSSPSYSLHLPEALTSGAIFASPHSGRDYPADFLRRSVLDLLRLRSSEDAFVDRFLEAVPAQGATLLLARFPRAYVDLNRGVDELDPALIEGVMRPGGNPRVIAGLGVIPRVVSGGRAIYSGKLTRGEAEGRLAQVWQPYHFCLQKLLRERRARFGRAVLFDLHSMPSEALDGQVPRGTDVVLGDRYGSSAGAELVSATEAIFRAAGLRVSRNVPFAGAYVAQRYGRPAEGSHVLQIEINRALYMDEAQVLPRADFSAFAGLMQRVTAQLAGLERRSDRLAAE